MVFRHMLFTAIIFYAKNDTHLLYKALKLERRLHSPHRWGSQQQKLNIERIWFLHDWINQTTKDKKATGSFKRLLSLCNSTELKQQKAQI